MSKRAEETLEEMMLADNKGDAIYYWVPVDMDQDDAEKNMNLNFWSLCDHLNAGRCRCNFYLFSCLISVFGVSFTVIRLIA